MNVHILHTGKVLIDQALAYQEKGLHPAPYTGWFRSRHKKRWVPVSTYLIEHPKGLILVDTGWNEAIRGNQKTHLGRLAYSMFRGNLPEGQSIREQLHQLGYQATDLDYVLLTHLHADHVSGLSHVSEAKKILISDIEWKAAQWNLSYNAKMWKDIPVATFSFSSGRRGPYQKEYDLLGDGSVLLIYTPGHSKGQYSVLVQTEKKSLLLASDTGYSDLSWKQVVLPGITTNQKQARQTLEWVRSMENKVDRIIVNHDVDIQPQVIHL